ncbi:MAG: hypothetical protein ACI3VU_00825 [Faecousia sp.]
MDRMEPMEDAEIEALVPYVSSEWLIWANQCRFRSDRVQAVAAFFVEISPTGACENGRFTVE